MRYQDPVTGEWKTISVKAADTLPIGTIVDYDGDTVPDGWEEIPDYSEEEIDTGEKWIDGKSIYQKVISFTVPDTANTDFVIGTISQISQFISVTGVLSARFPLPFVWNTLYFGISTNESKQLNGRTNWDEALNKKGYLIVKYTKIERENTGSGGAN